jgi:hypothetical protein
MVLGFNDLMEADKPDQAMWLDDDALIEHFAFIKEMRASGTGQVPMDRSNGPMERNALVDQYR